MRSDPKPVSMCIGDSVLVTDGSSEGHTGVILVITTTCIRIRRDADGIEVDVAFYYVQKV